MKSEKYWVEIFQGREIQLSRQSRVKWPRDWAPQLLYIPSGGQFLHTLPKQYRLLGEQAIQQPDSYWTTEWCTAS